MIDIRLIRESPAAVRAALARRDQELVQRIDAIVKHDECRRSLLKRVERLKAERNRSSEEVAQLKKEKADATALLAEL
ncbi:MAG: hypothetical protein P8X82_08265, partial [Gemmatimonadales bacterium]